MGRPFRILLSSEKVYACGACRTHLASGEDLVSKVRSQSVWMLESG